MKRLLTPRGLAMLQKELTDLKAQRPALAEAIEIAREKGDLSENADYDAAKNNSGMIEAKIRDVEGRLSNYQLVDPRDIGETSKVVFGCSVKLLDLDSDEEKIYSIYGTEESDISKGWISYETPLAKGLIGRELGDVVTMNLPGGQREYEILEVFVDYEE